MNSTLMAESLKKNGNCVANCSISQATVIYNYTVGSGDMYYEEVAERNVFIRGDEESGFHIWAECVAGGKATAVDLDEILLEGALASEVRGRALETERLADNFAERLGQSVARHVSLSLSGKSNIHRAMLTLKCILGSMHIPFTPEQIDDEINYVFDQCPLCNAAERSGIRTEVELAHHELGTLISSAIGFIDPEFRVRFPSDRYAEHVFAIIKKACP
jgi:hypothetical protein